MLGRPGVGFRCLSEGEVRCRIAQRDRVDLISAAEERRMIIRRTLAGKREKASRGGFSGGAAPLGYERDREGGLAVVDKESRTV